MITITENNIFQIAGGLSTKIPGWAKFAAAATPGARDEGMLIINSRLNACAKIARLNRLMSRWLDHERRSRPVSSSLLVPFLAALLLTACTAFAAAPREIHVENLIPDDDARHAAAAATTATLEAINAKVRESYPGLARYARERGYRIIVTDLPGATLGRHTGRKKWIELDYTLGVAPARLAEVYAHEIGHAIYEGLSHIERRVVVTEYAAAKRAGGMPDLDINEVFAELTARIATGRLSTKLPATQRIIRRRICQ